MIRRLVTLCCLGLGLGSSGSFAAPVTYQFTLLVESAETYPAVSSGAMDCASFVSALQPAHLFGCGIDPGDTFMGQFELFDDTAALADDVYSFLPLKSWSLQIGSVVWDTSLPQPASDLSAFRDGAYCGAAGVGLGGTSPGLKVQDGSVVGFCGGPYGSADAPFVDFELFGLGTFSTVDRFGARLLGSYEIARVPEPQTLALTGLALACVVAVRRRKPRHGERSPTA